VRHSITQISYSISLVELDPLGFGKYRGGVSTFDIPIQILSSTKRQFTKSWRTWCLGAALESGTGSKMDQEECFSFNRQMDHDEDSTSFMICRIQMEHLNVLVEHFTAVDFSFVGFFSIGQ